MTPDMDEDFSIPEVDDTDTDGVEYPADVEAPAPVVQPPVQAAPTPPPPEPKPEPEFIDIKPEKAEPPTLVEQFLRKHASEQRASLPEYVPPPMTERQKSQREIEMEAGRKRVQHFEEQKKVREQVRPSEAEQKAAGSSVPVFRPEDYVPVDPALKGLSQRVR